MTEEIRTTSSTGGQKGVKAQRYDLLPKPGLDAIAEVYAFGAQKYADHNWRKGYEWGKSYAALMRHMTAFWEGETNDPESGLPHLAHAGFHVLTMLTWLSEQGEGGEFDDRYRKPVSNTLETRGVQSGLVFVDEAQEFCNADLTSMLSVIDQEVVRLAQAVTVARFVAGPWGTEDTDDSMTTTFEREVAMDVKDALNDYYNKG